MGGGFSCGVWAIVRRENAWMAWSKGTGCVEICAALGLRVVLSTAESMANGWKNFRTATELWGSSQWGIRMGPGV